MPLTLIIKSLIAHLGLTYHKQANVANTIISKAPNKAAITLPASFPTASLSLLAIETVGVGGLRGMTMTTVNPALAYLELAVYIE